MPRYQRVILMPDQALQLFFRVVCGIPEMLFAACAWFSAAAAGLRGETEGATTPTAVTSVITDHGFKRSQQ